MKLTIKCDWCGKEVERDESKTKGKKHLLESQSEHAKLHMRERKFWNGGDAR